jgi:hypothetical protein
MAFSVGEDDDSTTKGAFSVERNIGIAFQEKATIAYGVGAEAAEE